MINNSDESIMWQPILLHCYQYLPIKFPIKIGGAYFPYLVGVIFDWQSQLPTQKGHYVKRPSSASARFARAGLISI